MKSLATLSIEDVLEFHSTNNLRKLLPMSMQVDFRHPLRNDILIFILIVNALERSGEVDSRNLFFEKNHMSLKMLENIWHKSARGWVG